MKTTNPWILVLAVAIAPAFAGCNEDKSVRAHVSDATITTSVKSSLIGDADVKARKIDVDTQNGVVYLTGMVESQMEKDEAERLAKGCDGVTRVVNNLQIGP
jgi:hyperosmotically inducible protein